MLVDRLVATIGFMLDLLKLTFSETTRLFP
jgi:hypothetical protein